MKRLLLLTLICVFCAGANGYWLPLTPGAANNSAPAIAVQDTTLSETTFDLVLAGVNVQSAEIEGAQYETLELQDAGWLVEAGAPRLPAIRKNIIVPFDASVSLEITANQVVEVNDINVLPAQPSYKRNEEKPAFVLNQRIYHQDTAYPGSWGRISQDGVMRDFRFVTVEINPVQVIPATGQLMAATDLSVRVVTDGGSSFGPREVYPVFDGIYRNSLENYDRLQVQTRSDAEPMLIICYDNFISDMAAFVEWKTKRGVDVTMVSSTETGTSANAIQSYIQTVWSTWNPQPVYIILVGDAPQLTPLTGIGSCASDSMFTLLEGSDLVPDVLISRFSAQNSGELNTQLDKVLTYEQTPVAGDWFNAFAGMASNEGSGPSDEEYSQEIEARMMAHNPDSAGDRIYQGMGHGATQISAAVNEGRYWLSYFGHGSGTSWSAPSFTNSNVDSLTNDFMTPFIMDVSCSNGGFNTGSDCFAERWMKGDDGAVGMFSSSTSCSWDEPANMAWGVCYSVTGNSSGTIPGGNHIMGQMTLDGYNFMYSVFGTGSATEEVMNQYVLFGDCSALFRSDTPIDPDVTHLATAPMVPATFEVQVAGIAGATVCAYKPGEVHETAITDGSGIAMLDIHPTTVGDMLITVFGPNLIPETSIVAVAPAGCGVIAMDRTGYNCDDTIQMVVFDSHLNLNPGSVETVVVDISSDSEPTPEDVILTETGPDTAEFTGTIMTSDSMGGQGYLLVSAGDTVTAHYADTDCDGSAVDVYDSAGVDCTGPVISDLTIEGIGTSSAIITWTTSEACDTRVTYGDSTPPTTIYHDSTMTTEHSVTLEELTDCTTYRFMVDGTDAYGNMGLDDNGGAYYSFTTWELQVFFSDDMESGENGWSYNGLWHLVPETSSCNESHSGVQSWYFGQESDCSYDTGSTAIGTLTSPEIDLTGILDAELHLWYWHEGENSSSYDNLTISVQIVGGAETVIHEQTETSNGWQELVVDMSSVADNVIQIKCLFDSNDSYMNDYRGSYIDDVEVIAAQPCEQTCVNDGDVSLDGDVTAGDAQLGFQIALGAYTPSVDEECAADCNGDGSVTAGDAQQIFQTALGQTTCADQI